MHEKESSSDDSPRNYMLINQGSTVTLGNHVSSVTLAGEQVITPSVRLETKAKRTNRERGKKGRLAQKSYRNATASAISTLKEGDEIASTGESINITI